MIMTAQVAKGLVSLALAMLLTNQVDAAQMRSITVQDCVRTRRVADQEVRISPDGSRVAYVVKAPDAVTNANNYQLYIRNLKGLGRRRSGHLLLQASRISGILWLSPTRIILRIDHK